MIFEFKFPPIRLDVYIHQDNSDTVAAIKVVDDKVVETTNKVQSALSDIKKEG